MPDTTTPAGAMPVAAGAMPVQTPPALPVATTPPAAPPPATGDPEALGDAGKRAIDAMKAERNAASERARDAEAALETLRTASQTDQEKALTAAKRDAAVEERGKWQAHIRATEVRSQLRAAGLANEKTLGLAAGAPEFAKLKVTDDGVVEQVAETVEAFKKDYPDLFTPAGSGEPTRGAQTGQPAMATTLEGAIAEHYTKH